MRWIRPTGRGPLSVHSSNRKVLALGSSRPARAWTAVVIRPSGAPGVSTIPAAASDHGRVPRVEGPSRRGSCGGASASGGSCRRRHDSSERDRGGADDARVEQHDREQRAEHCGLLPSASATPSAVGKWPTKGGITA